VADIVPAVNEKVEYVARHLPEASVTFDGFHVIQLANQAVDQVRRREAAWMPSLPTVPGKGTEQKTPDTPPCWIFRRLKTP